MARNSISVLIPALDEELNVAATVERVLNAANGVTQDVEIIVVNDGSTDGTGAAIDILAQAHPMVRALHNPRNMGLGYSYARGYREATKEFLVYIPGDNTWPTESLKALFSRLGDADIITSYAANPEVRPIGRRWLSKTYTAILNLLFGHRLHYFNGLTIYPIEFLRGDPAQTMGFGFQAEVLLKALAAGYSVVEVPLPIDERTSGRSKAISLRNVLGVGLMMMRLLYRLRIRSAPRRRLPPLP